MQRLLTAAATTIVLSSCGIYSQYKPVSEVPDALYGEQAQSADTIPMDDTEWRKLFSDPHLQRLIEKGLENNIDLRLAELRIREAEATLLSSKLAYLPSLALSPQGTVSSFDSQKATQSYSLPVTASWEIDIFGRMRNAKRQAQALYAQSQDYHQAVRTQLVTHIANTYYTLLLLDAQVEIAEQTEASWQETVASARALMEAGMANEAAVAQMEAARCEVAASVLDLKEQINQTENSMSLLLAETPKQIERGDFTHQEWPQTVHTGLPIALLSRRPDVRAAQRGIEQAFYATNEARSSFYPNITLSGSAGWTNSAGIAIVNPGKFLASAVGSLTQPLFARGQLTARLKIAKAQQEEARLQFEQTLLQAGMEVNEALTQHQTAIEKRRLIDEQVSSLQTAYQSTSLLMQHGTTTYLEVLTARQNLLSARLNQAANRFAEVQSLLSLYQALGGDATVGTDTVPTPPYTR